MLRWLTETNIDTAYIDPLNPWQNGSNESFNGKLRDECLSMEWFRNRIDAKIVIGNWRRQYKEIRPLRSLEGLTPREFAMRAGVNSGRKLTDLVARIIGAGQIGHLLSKRWSEESRQVSRFGLTISPVPRTS